MPSGSSTSATPPPAAHGGLRSAPARPKRRSDGEQTRQRVIDAALASILENGYYQTSSNEIARRAGVTWGALQHQFGSRENLLLEVLNFGWSQLQASLEGADVQGATLEARLMAMLAVLERTYGQPEHLANLQILLDLSHDPNTSSATREAADAHAARMGKVWQPFLAAALGGAAADPELSRYAFGALRGYLVGQLLSSASMPLLDDRAQRELLVRGVALSLREGAHERGLAID